MVPKLRQSPPKTMTKLHRNPARATPERSRTTPLCDVFHGKDAEKQPGRSGDLWLHETTVSWMRERMKRTQPVEPWTESEPQLAKRLKTAAAHCTSEYDIEALCKEFPARMHALVHVTKGDKLGK